MLSYFYWDPNPEILPIELPFLHRGILWYGFLFALGFFIGYGIFRFLAFYHFRCTQDKQRAILKKQAAFLADKITFYIVLGALIGARLGDVLFYQDWHAIVREPLSVFHIWEGGLSSHGGVIGILIALWLFSKSFRMSFLSLLDLLVIPAAFAALCIRIGNFFNQEILGTPTTLPWGVIFGHPVDKAEVVPRHPVQLYEALWYGLIFIFLLAYFKRHPRLEAPGRIAGLFFILVFGFRFCIEFIKVEQSKLLLGNHSPLTMGQWLSIPLICLGLLLLLKRRSKVL